jgi:hypothetical protein
MPTLPPNLRYERKFIVRGLSLAEVLALVRRHPALFREVYPGRAVNNLYLDSVGLRHYLDHVHGTANRTKIRVRWYGPMLGQIAAPNLECKIKRGLVSGKVTHALSALAINGRVDRRALAAAVQGAAVPPTLQASWRGFEPTLLNRYERRYFLSADRRCRLTVDSALAFYDVCRDGGAIRPAAPAPPIIIVELKFRPEDTEAAAAVTNEWPFRLVRCSKYILGIDLARAAHAG